MKYALVTGSGQGIGRAVADRLAAAGETVVFRNGRKPRPDHPNYIQADLSALDGMETLAAEVERRTEKLDILVLNAGATCRKPFGEIGPGDWQKVMDTNLNIPFFLVQRLRDRLADGGCILFISSMLALRPHASSIPYGVSKAAVNMLAQSLVKEFSPRKIRVNAVCPGFIDTPWQREKPEWLREKIAAKTALGRFGTPEEIAQLCAAVCENTYVNGSVIRADGGYDMA